MKKLVFSLKKKDFEIQTFRSGGKGGQHQNKTDSGVRIIHAASGARAVSRSEKSQYQNKRIAFKRLVKSFQFNLWVHRVVSEIYSGETLEQKVEKQLTPKNLKIEGINRNGRWIDISEQYLGDASRLTETQNNP